MISSTAIPEIQKIQKKKPGQFFLNFLNFGNPQKENWWEESFFFFEFFEFVEFIEFFEFSGRSKIQKNQKIQKKIGQVFF